MPLPQRFGCLGWALAGAAVVLAVLGGFAWWFMSEGDMRAALDGPGGRPPVPAQLTLPPVFAPDPALIALRELLLAHDLGRTPLPQEFPAAVHRAVVAARLSGFGLDRLLGLQLLRGERVEWEGAVVGELALRIRRDPPTALAGLAADATGVIALAVPCDDDERRTTMYCAIVLARAVTVRLADLGPAEATPLTASMRDLRDHLWRGRAAVFAADIARERERVASRAILRRFAGGGWTDLAPRLRAALDERWERADALHQSRTEWWLYAGAATPADLVARVSAGSARVSLHAWDHLPHELLAHALMALDALLATLEAVGDRAKDATPPEDAYAPGHPLCPILRAGPSGSQPRRIGWYSVGIDGRDDGGDAKRDIGFASGTEKLGSPRFADTVDVGP